MPLIDAAGDVAVDVVCLQCGYNLRGLHPNTTCPECGYSVATSIKFHNIGGDPRWLTSLARGAVCVVFSFVIAWSGWVALAVLDELHWFDFTNWEWGLLACLPLCPLPLGLWWLTTPQPDYGIRQGHAIRGVARGVGLVTLLCPFVAFVMLPARSEVVAYSLTVLLLLLVLAWTLYLSGLARRFGRRGLAGHTMGLGGVIVFAIWLLEFSDIGACVLVVCVLDSFVLAILYSFMFMEYADRTPLAVGIRRSSLLSLPTVSMPDRAPDQS